MKIAIIIFLWVFVILFQCCKLGSDKTQHNSSINDEIKKEIYLYSDELKGVFGEFPLNIVVDINDKNDTLIIRFGHITPFYFDVNLVKKNIWFNEKIKGVNYYYITNSGIAKIDTSKVLALNQDNKEHDIYYYAKELLVVNGHILKRKNIHWTKIKWLQIPPPPQSK